MPSATFSRTMIELKQVVAKVERIDEAAFSRTMIELKRDGDRGAEVACHFL